MCVCIFGNRRLSSVLPIGHSRLIGRQFLPMLSSLPGFMIGMIINYDYLVLLASLVSWIAALLHCYCVGKSAVQ